MEMSRVDVKEPMNWSNEINCSKEPIRENESDFPTWARLAAVWRQEKSSIPLLIDGFGAELRNWLMWCRQRFSSNQRRVRWVDAEKYDTNNAS